MDCVNIYPIVYMYICMDIWNTCFT